MVIPMTIATITAATATATMTVTGNESAALGNTKNNYYNAQQYKLS
jgi:hypothetical protein